MKTKFDVENWARREHFEFFGAFEEPFFGLCVDVDCTRAYRYCKKTEQSFFLYYLHASLTAANAVEAFRLRIEDGDVWLYDRIDGSATISRENGTFGFSWIEYDPDFEAFTVNAQKEIARVRSCTDLLPARSGENVIHYSSTPWIQFTALSHARPFSRPDSCPKISFGKTFERDGRKMMPMSIHAHHALMDGLHVGQYIDRCQLELDRNA